MRSSTTLACVCCMTTSAVRNIALHSQDAEPPFRCWKCCLALYPRDGAVIAVARLPFPAFRQRSEKNNHGGKNRTFGTKSLLKRLALSKEISMHSIFYVIGVIVVVLFAINLIT